MKLVLQPEIVLYVRSMGKALRVTAIADTVEEANQLGGRANGDHFAVVAEVPPLILMADRYDHGTKISD